MNPIPLNNAANYEVESILGKGGMGVVYLAHDKRLNRKVAIKCIRQNRTNEHWVEAVQEEAKLLAQINHTNIVQIYDLIDWHGVPALVMEYVCGRTLLDLLNSDELHSDAIDFKQRLDWLKQIAEGLACAHAKGIIHRDLKPENIMIASDGAVKIMDFGIARHQAQPKHTNIHDSQVLPGEFVGSPGSLSPEQALGEDLTTASDVFSFGILAYSLMCGHHPFGDTSDTDTLLHSILYRAPAPFRFNVESDERAQDVAEIIEQSLQKKAESRPTTNEMAQTFRPLETNSVTSTLERSENRQPFLISAVIAVGAVLLLIIVVALWAGQTLGVKTQYVAVLEPTLYQPNISNSDATPLILAAFDNTIQEALLSQPNIHLIDRQELEGLTNSSDIEKKTGATDVIKPQVTCSHGRCKLTLERINTADSSVTARKTWEIIADANGDLYYTSWRNALALLDSTDEQPSDIANKTYSEYLTLLEKFNRQGWLSISELEDATNLVSNEPQFSPAQRLLARASIANYHATNNSENLASFYKTLEKNLTSLDEKTRTEISIEILLALKQFDSAKKKIETLRHQNDLTSYYELKARLALELNLFDDAKKQYIELFNYRRSAQYLYSLAYCEYSLGNLHEASKQLKKLLTLAPGHKRATSFLAGIEMTEGNYAEAIVAFQSLLSEAPNPADYANLAIAQMLIGDFEGALGSQKANLQIAPNDPNGLTLLGEIYLSLNRPKDAETQFTLALKNLKSTDDLSDLILRATLNTHLSNLTEAEKNINKAKLISSDSSEVNYVEALFQTSIGNSALAIEKVQLSLQSGYSIEWFSFPWFGKLCDAEEFQSLFNGTGQKSPCSVMDGRTNLVE